MSLITLDTQIKVAEWQKKCREGTMTLEEYREVIAHMRQGRVAAAKASASKGSRTKKVAVNSDDLLAELGGLPGA